jgi:hypothetical protein
MAGASALKALAEISPGQRPGFSGIHEGALKGRAELFNQPRLLRPFGAAGNFLMIPRALPWAVMLRALGAMPVRENG